MLFRLLIFSIFISLLTGCDSKDNNPTSPPANHIKYFGFTLVDTYWDDPTDSETKSNYNDDSFKMKKLDAPILVGTKVFGPLSVFAGPSFQYILDTEFDGVSINNIDKDLSVGLNFGIGLNLNKIGIDVRYERGFSNNEANFLNNNNIEKENSECKHDNKIHYGKFGYYFKCSQCNTNTKIKETCSSCNSKNTKIRKSKNDFFIVCKDCNQEKFYWKN